MIENRDILIYVLNKLRRINGKRAFAHLLYLLQREGVPITYMFRYWVHGIYNEELTQELNFLIAEGVFECDVIGGKPCKLYITKDNQIKLPKKITERIDTALGRIKEETSNFDEGKIIAIAINKYKFGGI